MHPRIPTRKLSTLQAHDKNKAPPSLFPTPQPPFTVMRSISTSRSLIDCPMKMRSESHSLSSHCRWPDITTEPRGGVLPHCIPTTNSWCTMSRAFMIPDGDSRIGRVHTANRRRWIQITVHDVGVGFNERITPRIYCSATLTVEIYSWHV